jgi:hypothetical protein
MTWSVCRQAYEWMKGIAMQPLLNAEEALEAKVQELGHDFVMTLFSGISSQELKRAHTAKDSFTCPCVCAVSAFAYHALTTWRC